jgi:hypothetical protein
VGAALWFLPALAANPGPEPQSVLAEAEIAIAVARSEAQVSARYRILAPGARVVLYAPRFLGSHLLLRDLSAPLESLHTLPGILRLVLRPDTARGATEIDLGYRLSGELSRLPIFVPQAPTSPLDSRVAIAVFGLPERSVPRDRFPRLQLDSMGAWRADPDHVPSFVALWGSRKPAVPQVVEWSVLGVAVGGTLLWLLRVRSWQGR